MTTGSTLLRRVLAGTAALVAAAALAACVDILPKPGAPARIYVLPAPSAVPTAAPARPFQLVVAAPLAPEALASNRIAVKRAPRQLDFYSDARWIEPVPAMVQAFVTRAFQASGRLRGVARRAASLRADYVLELELYAFQVEHLATGKPPRARVRLAARLVRLPQRIVVDARTFEATRPVEAATLDSVADGFGAALNQIVSDLVPWVLDSMAAKP